MTFRTLKHFPLRLRYLYLRAQKSVTRFQRGVQLHSAWTCSKPANLLFMADPQMPNLKVFSMYTPVTFQAPTKIGTSFLVLFCLSDLALLTRGFSAASEDNMLYRTEEEALVAWQEYCRLNHNHVVSVGAPDPFPSISARKPNPSNSSSARTPSPSKIFSSARTPSPSKTSSSARTLSPSKSSKAPKPLQLMTPSASSNLDMHPKAATSAKRLPCTLFTCIVPEMLTVFSQCIQPHSHVAHSWKRCQ